MNLLEVSELSSGYGKREILKNCSFSLAEGKILGILGPNGCGKTTLLKSLCGIIRCKGSVMLHEANLLKLSPKHLARLVGYIPQKTGIAISMSALDVVLMGFNPQLGLLEYPDSAMKKKALDALNEVGIAQLANQDFLTLSQGQMQLCLLARAIVSDASLLLLDEPESALDFNFRYRCMELLKSWVKKAPGRSVIITLHDPNLALNTCDELLLMKEDEPPFMISPAAKDEAEIEAALTKIYGPLCVKFCYNHSNRKQLVLLTE